MKRQIFILHLLVVLCVLFVPVATSQNQEKSWKEWSKKDVEKMLTNSPWAHMQIETDTSEMFFQPTADPRTSGNRAPNSGQRLEQGASNQAINIKYGIRFFSARPVRQAFVRTIQLSQPKLEPDVIARMNSFAELPPSDALIIAVTIESTDKRVLGHAL